MEQRKQSLPEKWKTFSSHVGSLCPNYTGLQEFGARRREAAAARNPAVTWEERLGLREWRRHKGRPERAWGMMAWVGQGGQGRWLQGPAVTCGSGGSKMIRGLTQSPDTHLFDSCPHRELGLSANSAGDKGSWLQPEGEEGSFRR